MGSEGSKNCLNGFLDDVYMCSTPCAILKLAFIHRREDCSVKIRLANPFFLRDEERSCELEHPWEPNRLQCCLRDSTARTLAGPKPLSKQFLWSSEPGISAGPESSRKLANLTMLATYLPDPVTLERTAWDWHHARPRYFRHEWFKPVSELALKLHRCMLVTLDLAYLSFKAQDAEASGDEPAISALSQCCIVLLSLCL